MSFKKQYFKNISLAVAVVFLFCTTAIINSCNKDKDDDASGLFNGKIEGTLTNEAATYQEVRAYLDNDTETPLITAPVVNSKFSIELPDLGASYLLPFADWFETLQPNPADAKAAQVIMYVYKSSGGENRETSLEHSFDYEMDRKPETVVFYFYADKDVTVSGTEDDTVIDIHLKRGWNTVIETVDRKAKTSTLKTGPVPSNCTWNIETSL